MRQGNACQVFRPPCEQVLLRDALGEIHPEVAATLLDMGRVRYRPEPAAGRADVFRAIAILGSHQHRPRLFAQSYLLLAKMLQPSSAAIWIGPPTRWFA